MTTVASPTGDCRHCGKPIRRNKAGCWGARKRNDPHPWCCKAATSAAARHEPVPAIAGKKA
jgi:hypothetical protein